LTEKLGRAAWTLFQEIEAAGGAAAALDAGLIQKKVAAIRSQRDQAVARRVEVLIGTSEFPNLQEVPVRVLDAAPVVFAIALSVAAPQEAIEQRVEPMVPYRLAEPFEALRDASDRMLAATGQRPRMFLANLGAAAEFTARANFAKHFFEAGGIEAVTNEGFANHAELVAAFKASGMHLACLCSSDAVYAREAADAARALTAAGASSVHLAGRPGALEGQLQAAGVTGFIFADCDAVERLRDLHRQLGIA
jgi:methylmalonyl-CoA mutase